jgi:Ras-related protein Rab-8A
MYDITNVNSFNNIRSWIKLIEENDLSNICKVLVGNNCDKPDRKVTEAEGKKLADDFNMAFFETSPNTNQNINEVFNYLVGEILKIQEDNNIQKNINIKK